MTAVPIGGLACYSGAIDGFVAFRTQGSYVYRLEGYSFGSILANFLSGEVRRMMTIASLDPRYFKIAIGGYRSISASTGVFSGTLGRQGYADPFQGGFFGPAALEAGATFALNGPTQQETLSGVIAA